MKSPKTEQWLNKHPDVTWHFEEKVDISKIDKEASIKNQARFKALDYDHVDDIVVRLIDDWEMPALVAYWHDGKLVIADGNHRHEAYIKFNELDPIRKITKTDFYIVDNPHNYLIDTLTREANTHEGWPITKEERIEHAKYMVTRHDENQYDAEKKFGLTKGTLNRLMAASKIEERLAKLGFQEKLPMRHLSAIGRIKPDKILLETANLIKDAKLDMMETEESARRIASAAASEKQQLSELAKIRSDYDDRIKRIKRGETRKTITPIVRYRRGVNDIISTREESIKPLEDTVLRRRSLEARRKIDRILE